MSEKIAIVTGSNKGIGYGIVKGLCEKYDGLVYLTSRDVNRGETAVAKLKELGFNPLFHQLDITDESSVKKFQEYLKDKHGGIDLLINNAAIAFPMEAPEPFSEQAQKTNEVNYFATLKVCEILFPILRQNARVVNVSSSSGHLSRIPSLELRAKFNDPALTVTELSKLIDQFIEDAKNNRHHATWGTSAYVVSKVGLSALTRIQQREFDKESPNRNIAVNSVHPGYVDTDMSNHKGPWTIEQGAAAPLWLALDAPDDVRGQYVWKDATIAQWDAEKPPASV